jgi:hypothetical protein
MIKRYIWIFVILFFSIINFVYWTDWPPINCEWLPWCENWEEVVTWKVWLNFIANAISEFISFIAVIAVFAVIFSWVMYLLSAWDEEKTKKAKNWIIYSLVWVLLSISAWGIVNLLNNLKIG